MFVPPDVVAALLGGGGTAGLIFARVWQRTEQTYRILTGYEERDDDGLIDQVEATQEMAERNRELLRGENIK